MKIKKILEKIFKHELSMWIHRLNLVAALLAFLHVLLIPYIRSIIPFTILVILYTVIAFGAYGHYAYNKYLKLLFQQSAVRMKCYSLPKLSLHLAFQF